MIERIEEDEVYALSSPYRGLVILNVVDLLFTVTYLELGLVTEANPIMAAALEESFLLFVVSKVGLVTLGAYALSRVDTYLVRKVAEVLLLLYGLTVSYHVLGGLYDLLT